MMKKLVVGLVLISAAGCMASPIDPLIPARKPSPATTEYLGHLYQTNYVNRMYYSVSDARINKTLVPIRKTELEGLYVAAKGETDFFYQLGANTSNLVWGGITMALTALGIMTPRPQEKHKVEAALRTPVPEK